MLTLKIVEIEEQCENILRLETKDLQKIEAQQKLGILIKQVCSSNNNLLGSTKGCIIHRKVYEIFAIFCDAL